MMLPTQEPLRAELQALADRLRPQASANERARELPLEAFQWFKTTKLGTMRLPVELGGSGASVEDVMAVVSTLAEADPNVAHALRAHFNFVELQLLAPAIMGSPLYMDELRKGAIFGGAHTEIGTKKAGDIATQLSMTKDGWRLSGKKYYTTGTAFSDWVTVTAVNPTGQLVRVLVPTSRKGITIRDDWDGMGQRLTASGGIDFEDVVVEADEITAERENTVVGRHASTFRQLYLAACQAGIVRNVLSDAVSFVVTKARPIAHSQAQTAREDQFVQSVVGSIAACSFALDAQLARAAATMDLVHKEIVAKSPRIDELLSASSIEVAKLQIASAELAIRAAEQLFETGGASATSRKLNFDRHWRNIRTIQSHNPIAHKRRVVGDYLLNRTAPPIDGGYF
ncbi:MAG: acyl-CoA dehydrogenase family protein [Parvibaculaceae bacterium]